MTQIIKTFASKYKQKKKPGWKKEQQEYQEWLNKVNSMSSGIKPAKKVSGVTNPVVSGVFVRETNTEKIPLSNSVGNGFKKQVNQKYDDENLQERENKAREIKYVTGPVYNKGNDVLLTEEMLKDIKSGVTRRRN